MATKKQAAPAQQKDTKVAPKAAKAPKGAGATTAAGDIQQVSSARLQSVYREQIVPELMKKFGYKSVMQVPRLQKITLNMGVSEAVADKKIMDNAVGDL